MIDRKQAEQARASSDPLDQAAGDWLQQTPWRGVTGMPMLALMLWGIKETDLVVPDVDAVEQRVVRMMEEPPERALALLLDPEETGDVMLTAAELQMAETPEDAAWLLLDALHGAMVATNDPLLGM